jgi:signal transduction histidine kinase
MYAFVVLSGLLVSVAMLLGLLVLLRNHKNSANNRFFLVCFFAALWGIAFEWTLYIFVNPPSADRITLLNNLNKFSFFMGILLMLSMVAFTFYFPIQRPRAKLRFFSILATMTAGLSLYEMIAGNTTIDYASREFVISTGDYVWVYVLVMLFGTVLIAVNMFAGRKNFSSTQRAQNKLLTVGFSSGLIIGLILAVLSPIVFPNQKFDAAAPLALLFFIVPVAAAVTKFKLFEFRLILVRSLAYFLSVTTLVIVYGLFVLSISRVLFSDETINPYRQLLYVAAAVVLGLLVPSVKKFFDKLTSSLFFREAYDPQQLLDSLNKVLISTIELNNLLSQSSRIIRENLKTEHVAFIIKISERGDYRLIGVGEKQYTDDEIKKIVQLADNYWGKVVVVDDIEDEKLKAFYDANDIGLIFRLSQSTKSTTDSLGYLALGPKSTGGIYTSQDVRIIEIIADEFVIAIQNALRFEEIQQFNITLQQKVDKATSELRKTNQKLLDLDEAKDEFISMASHQLRTPLTSMKGYVSMVLEGDSGKISAMQRKLLDQAFVSSQRMVYLIADLLNVSRLKTGKFIIETKPADMAEVVEQEISQLTETAKGRNLELTYDKPKKFPMLMLDETKIRQVIMNFADNAIYYTPSGGHIKVNLEEKKDTIEFTVVDDGLGVPKAEQHHLFNKFYRASNAKKARPDGTGLGLFMAKKVIVAQGGAIIFSSTEGKGSTFGFSFSKVKLKPTAAQLKSPDVSVSTTTSVEPEEAAEQPKAKEKEPPKEEKPRP